METTILINIIKTELTEKSGIELTYYPRTTSTNGSYIEVKLGETLLQEHFSEYQLKDFSALLNSTIQQLKTEYPDLHVITRKKEFHFFYPGFNSCFTETVPVSISNQPESSEPKKTGIVTEKYQMVGKTKVMEVINAHPGYELYKRTGFGFRGAQERPCSLDDMIKMLDWMACTDVEVIDNEIHVNGFSYSDMD